MVLSLLLQLVFPALTIQGKLGCPKQEEENHFFASHVAAAIFNFPFIQVFVKLSHPNLCPPAA